jgi:hypothetical protein
MIFNSSYSNLSKSLWLAYHKPLTKDTGRLPAEGPLLSFSHRVAFAEAKLTEAYEWRSLDKFKKG